MCERPVYSSYVNWNSQHSNSRPPNHKSDAHRGRGEGREEGGKGKYGVDRGEPKSALMCVCVLYIYMMSLPTIRSSTSANAVCSLRPRSRKSR